MKSLAIIYGLCFIPLFVYAGFQLGLSWAIVLPTGGFLVVIAGIIIARWDKGSNPSIKEED